MTGSIELAADGYPLDPALRRLADRTMAKLSTMRGARVETMATLVDWLTPWWGREPDGFLVNGKKSARKVGIQTKALVEALPALLDTLASAGHFSLTDGRLSVPVPEEYVANPLPRDRMLSAFAGRMAARRVTGEGERERLARLFLNLRALHAVHGTHDGGLVLPGCPAMGFLIPRGYRVDPEAGPVMTGGLLIRREPNGVLKGKVVPSDAIAVAFETPERAVVSVDAARLLPWRKTGFKVGDLTVSAVRWRRALDGDDRRIEPGWGEVSREDVAARLGFDMGGRQWKSFGSTLRRARRLYPGVGMAVFGMLDPEVRRACLRSPRAKVALANWFVQGGAKARTRRLQASAAYPVLTPWLHHASAEIDAGAPLAPVLAARLGLPPLLVRELGGRHWQSLGSMHARLVTTRRNAGRLSYAIRVIPPERIPRTKVQWEGFLASITVLVEALGSPGISRLTRDLSLDWERTRRLADRGLHDSLAAVGLALRDACRHELPFTDWDWHQNDRMLRVRSLVVEAVVGPDGGLGRIRTFNERFHRQANALRQEHSRISQEAWAAAEGTDPDPTGGRWSPLTALPYVRDGGSIEWITDGNDLAEEGRAMRHCVAYRETDCRYGRTHVGRVTGAGGSRSTVEFRLAPPAPKSRDGSVSLVEHQAPGNTQPDPACEAVVASFLAEAANLVDSGPILAAGVAYARWSELRRRSFLPPEPALEVLRLYEGLLSPAYRGIPVEGWVERLAAALDKDGAAVPEGCALGDVVDIRMVSHPRSERHGLGWRP